MHRNFTPAHAKTLRQEMVVSLLFNAVIIPLILWLLGAPAPQTLFGPGTVLAALVPGAAAATFMMTIVVTTIVRARVSKGSLPAYDWPHSEQGMYRFVPENLLLRAMMLAGVAAITLVPTWLVAVAASGLLPFTKIEAAALNVLYGITVSLLMTRAIVLSALADSIVK